MACSLLGYVFDYTSKTQLVKIEISIIILRLRT